MTDPTISKLSNQYVEKLFIESDPDLDFAINTSKKHNLPPIQINPVMGKFLSQLVKMHNAKTILEIGTLGAYSTIWLAKALPKDGNVLTLEHNKSYAAVAQENITQAKLEDKIEIQTGEALELLPKLNPSFDFFFIDAHKEEYIQYVEHAIQLSRPGSVIVCDNVLRNGGVLTQPFEKEYYAKLHEFNDWLAKNEQLESTILPMVLPLTGRDYVDGMSISIVK